MGEDLLVPFPGPGPVLVRQDVPTHVPGERSQTGLYKPYSSVLLSQLNEGKRGAETCSWTKQRARHSHSSIPHVSCTLPLQQVSTAADLLGFPIPACSPPAPA